jgi:hypothetical protein
MGLLLIFFKFSFDEVDVLGYLDTAGTYFGAIEMPVACPHTVLIVKDIFSGF